MKKTPLFFICMFLTLCLYAQSPKTHKLSLKEAIAFALKNNRSIKSATLRIEAAKQQKWETTATGLPQINGKLEYQNYLVYPVPQEALNDPSSPIGFIFPKHKMSPTVTLSQLLFDSSYLVGLQSAKVFLDISKNSETKTKNNIEVEIIKAYANALLVEENLKITQKNKEALINNLKETKQVFKNGMIEEESVEQMELTLASIENNLNRLEQLKKISYNVLKVIFSVTQETSITLTDSLEDIYSKESLTKPNLNHSYFNNIDIKISENNKKSKELLYKLEKAKLLPSLSTYISAGYLGNSNNFTFLNSSQEWFGSVLLGVNLEIPIFSSFASRSKIKRAKINKDIAHNELLTTTATINVNVENAKNELDFAYKNYENKKKSLALATKIETKNNLKFKEGITSSFDLRQAQIQLYNSQQEYLQSISDIINKKAELQNLYK